MKKFVLRMFFTLGILFSVIMIGGSAQAEENLVINSEIPDKSAVDFATSDFNYSLNATLFMEKKNNNPQDYKLGSPFTVLNKENGNGSITFPVFYQDKIEYVYSVIKGENGEYTSTCSRFLASELQELKDEGITETTLYAKNDDIFYEKEGNLEVLFDSPISEENQDDPTINQEDVSVVNDENLVPVSVNEETEASKEKTLGVPRQTRSGVSSGTNYAMINFTITETQSYQSWCAAFVTAGILRNKNTPKSTTAKTIMKYFYPNLSDSALKAKSISQNQVVQYAKSKGCNPYLVNGMVDQYHQHTQIMRGNAIYCGTFGIQGQAKSRHAFALYGWVQQGNTRTLYFWNPWWSYPMVVNGNTAPIVIPTPAGGFVWDSTVTNF